MGKGETEGKGERELRDTGKGRKERRKGGNSV